MPVRKTVAFLPLPKSICYITIQLNQFPNLCKYDAYLSTMHHVNVDSIAQCKQNMEKLMPEVMSKKVSKSISKAG